MHNILNWYLTLYCSFKLNKHANTITVYVDANTNNYVIETYPMSQSKKYVNTRII